MSRTREVSPARRDARAGRSTTPIDVNVRSVALTVIAVAAAMCVLHWAQEVFIPIVLSILISYALEPIVRWLTRLRLPRVARVSAGHDAADRRRSATRVYSLSDDAAAIVAQLPEAAAEAAAGDATRPRRAGRDPAGAAGRRRNCSGRPTKPPGRTRRRAACSACRSRSRPSTCASTSRGDRPSLIAFAGQAMLVVFFVFFLLASGDLFKRKLVKLAGPSLEKKKITVQILDDINTQIERFLLVRVVTSVAVGVATWLAFRLRRARAGRRLGHRGRRLQQHSVLRTGDRRRRHGRRRVPAVRHDGDGASTSRASRWPSPASKDGC